MRREEKGGKTTGIRVVVDRIAEWREEGGRKDG